MDGAWWDFNFRLQHQQMIKEYPKHTFEVHLMLKLFRVTIADTDIGTLNFLHSFL